MNAYEAYRIYLSLKVHFTEESYNFFQGHLKVNVKTFQKRNDVPQFVRLAKHKDVIGLIVSNIIVREISGYDLNTSTADQIYNDWLRRKSAMSYIYSEEIKRLDPEVTSNFKFTLAGYPKVIRLYLQRKISLETFVILLYQTNTIKYYDKKLKDDTLWKELSLKIRKYKPFIGWKYKELNDIFREKFNIEQKEKMKDDVVRM